MPILPRKFCAQGGCSIRVDTGQSYCRTHDRTLDRARGTARQRGYSRRWDVAAARFRDTFPLCGECYDGHPVMSTCHDEHRPVVATVVDHKVPHRGDYRLFWDMRNWQSLCAECHAKKTAAGL